MTQEVKSLLLRVCCEGLPHGMMCDRLGEPRLMTGVGIGVIGTVVLQAKNGYVSQEYAVEDIKPYLRPLSSMTAEELNEYDDLVYLVRFGTNPIRASEHLLNFCNKHHLDYRGLIPKGLAVAVTEENNPYK